MRTLQTSEVLQIRLSSSQRPDLPMLAMNDWQAGKKYPKAFWLAKSDAARYLQRLYGNLEI